ncbi:hypothetical protein N7492_005182 [Penicillium capsulatum]|uniref:Uncharacterized protein n=1 Tax=Penicillium capsulatum TaxID=69766 RepID=A0A9W9I8X4_9EURO|nr:hypothetical protein N7492_005182 [Penicillium capsulatum]
MNVFRKNRKAKEISQPKEIKDTLADLESGPSTGFSLKPSKKKEAPETKPDLDLSGALPSTDDFRTSLLMPKLSARFSMLREQDDPASKLGKASDDSVLFPKRVSRMNLFGHNPSVLADIDEVSSNDGSRPSIALGRTDSYASGADGYGTDDDRSPNDSIMSRARRAEGNNLFGGRQKIYKIPVRTPGGSPITEGSRGRGMGKPVYENDLNLSAFQRIRRQEKERAAEEAAREAAQEDDAASTMSTQRTTSSSTASGPMNNGRTSTAATSIDEPHPSASPQPQDPVGEIRPSPAMSNPRTGSVRSRRLYGQGLTQTAQNQQSSTLHRLESLSRQRAGNSDYHPMNRNFTRSASSLRERMQRLPLAEPAALSRPTSPPSSATSPKRPTPTENAPNERMSPTAATFGSAPPLSPPSSETGNGASLLAAAINPEDRGKATAMGLFNRPATGFDEQQFMRRQLQMHQGRNTPPQRRPSPPRRPPPQDPSASSYYSSDAHHGIDHSRASSVEASPSHPGVRNYYANSTASDSGDEGEGRRSNEVSSITSMATDYSNSLHHSNTASKPPTPTGEHLETLPEVRYSDVVDLKPIEENEAADESAPSVQPEQASPERADSPILQPSTYGVDDVPSHLRQTSEVSRPPSPVLQQDSPAEKAEQREPVSPLASGDSIGMRAGRGSQESDISTLHDHHLATNTSSWKEELALHHRRDGSTETQKEREEFALELAERRRRVQEKLRSVAESESRSASPTPGWQTPESNQVKAGNAFALLKQKGSNPSSQKSDQKNKMYGYNSTSTPSLVNDDSARDEERPSFSFGRHSNSSSPHVGSERSFLPRMPALNRASRDESRESSRSRGASPSSFRPQRDRSNSDASGRSKSRTRYRDRDDLETVDEGAVIAHDNFVAPENYEHPPVASVPGSSRPSMEVEPIAFDRSASAASGRYRSASRSGTPNFQYERPFQGSQSNPTSMIGASPRPSPATPAYSANATPPLQEDQPDPSGPALSNHNLPQRAPGHLMLQKRAVNKRLISEPTFVSSTSNVPTVGIATPPVPPMNPRRRRGTQTILGAFKSEKSDSSRVSSPAPSITDETSVFPDDEKRPRSRNRLRKSSSEGGSLNARARQEAMADHVAPAVPHYPPPAIPVDGGMF